jgi:hypothetical protein
MGVCAPLREVIPISASAETTIVQMKGRMDGSEANAR